MNDKALAEIRVAIYHGSYALGSNFVKITQDVLHDVANVASDLHNCLPVPESDSMNGISRLTGYMNLLYHEASSTKYYEASVLIVSVIVYNIINSTFSIQPR